MEGKGIYNAEKLKQLGRLCKQLEFIVSDTKPDKTGPLPSSNVDIFPYKHFTILFMRAVRMKKMDKVLDKEITEFMEDLDMDIVEKEIDKPCPMEFRAAFWKGIYEARDEFYMKSKIKFVRNSKGLTQTELAEKIGATQKDISRWERGSVKPSDESLEKLAKALKCDIGELK